MTITNLIPQIFSEMSTGSVVTIKTDKQDLVNSLNDKLSYMRISYNKSSIMRRAYRIFKNERYVTVGNSLYGEEQKEFGINTFSDALRASWAESKKVVERNRKEISELVELIKTYN